MWGAEIKQLPTWAKQWGVSLFVIQHWVNGVEQYMYSNSRLLAHKENRWNNHVSDDNLHKWVCVLEGEGANQFALSQTDRTIIPKKEASRDSRNGNFQEGKRRRQGKKDQTRERKWVVCVFHSHIYVMCVCVHCFRTAHSGSCLRTLNLLNVSECQTLLPRLFVAFIAQAVLSNQVSWESQRERERGAESR